MSIRFCLESLSTVSLTVNFCPFRKSERALKWQASHSQTTDVRKSKVTPSCKRSLFAFFHDEYPFVGRKGSLDALAGALTDELRQAIGEHKAALPRHTAYPYVDTVDGRGTDPFCYGTRHGERLRDKIGVRLLHDGVERLYLPGTLWEAKRKESEVLFQ